MESRSDVTLRIASAWKWALSFRKRTWELSDYPAYVERFEAVADATAQGPRQDVFHVAGIHGWWTMTAVGIGTAQVMRALEEEFGRFVTSGRTLPRTGS